MSGDLAFPPGERQGDLPTSAKENRGKAKSLNFAVGWPSPDLVIRMTSHVWAAAYVMARKARYDQLVSEIGPWIMAARKRKASI